MDSKDEHAGSLNAQSRDRFLRSGQRNAVSPSRRMLWTPLLLRKVLVLAKLEKEFAVRAQDNRRREQRLKRSAIMTAERATSTDNGILDNVDLTVDDSRHSDDVEAVGVRKISADVFEPEMRRFNFATIVRLLLVVRKWIAGQYDENQSHLVDARKSNLSDLSFTDPVHEATFEGSYKANIWKKIRDAVFNPSKNFYYWWSAMISVFVLYNMTMVIARFSFPDLQLAYWQLFVGLDYVSDLMYIMDMGVESRKGFLEQGILVRDIHRLRSTYIKSMRFVWDVISILPTDFIYLALRSLNQPIVRINRIFRARRLFEFNERTETRTNFPNAFRVIKILVTVFVILHWNACFYFNLSLLAGLGRDRWVFSYINITDAYVQTGNGSFYVIPFSNTTKQYLYSLYWSTKVLMSLGQEEFPVSTAEFVFFTADILIGLLLVASIVGNVSVMISNMNAAKVEFQDRVDAVKQYMEYRHVHPALQQRVLKWFDYMRAQRQAFVEESAIGSLPTKLKAEMAIQVHLDTLQHVKLFQDCEPGVLVELILKLKLHVFSPGDFICRKGDVGNEMYIVKRGSLNVVSEDGNVVFVTLKEGSVFGELSVLNIPGNKTGNRRTASVRSVGYSDLFILSKDDLWAVLEEYPEAKRLLLHKGSEILRKDGLIDDSKIEAGDVITETIPEKLKRLTRELAEMMRELDGLYERFAENNQLSKQRITELEMVLKNAKHAIKRDILRGHF